MTIDKSFILGQYMLAWHNNERMASYCSNKVASVAQLPSGELICVDKKHIETRFCFGESGYDYDDALRAADHARTSEDHFRHENMKHFRDACAALENVLAPADPPPHLVTICRSYLDQPDSCRLRSFGFTRLNDILDACGGSAFLEELPGRELTVRGLQCRVANADEVRAILDAYREAAAEHEKKVERYLRRYGLSKVTSWTYWRDA